MTTRSRLAALLALACALGAPAEARADPAPAPEHDSAFKSGLEQYGRGNYVAAIATWESLLATMGEDRGYKVLFNLGLAYQQIGDVTKAIERYAAFVKQVEQQPYGSTDLAARADEAKARLAQLQEAYGAVNVHAPKRGGPILTRVGMAEPRAAGYVVWLAPGPHSVDIFVGTQQQKTITFEIVRGQTVDIDTSPPEEPPPPPPPPQETRPLAPAPDATKRIVILGATATAISLAVPLTLFFVAGGKRDDAEQLGRGHSGYADAQSSYDTWRTVYYVSYALPATLALATAAVWAFGSKSDATPSVAIGPTGAVVHGSF
ncbi:MAG: tetratricopeptide repeat protein [Labilithrix sp.]|nr:tetratricopeptide repeat protein [Labilithrix sp.]